MEARLEVMRLPPIVIEAPVDGIVGVGLEDVERLYETWVA